MTRYIFLIVLFLFVFPTYSIAADVTISLSPSVRYIVAKPGAQIVLPYTVVNYGNDAYISIEIKQFSWSPANDIFSFSPYISNKNTPAITSDVGEKEHFLLLSQEKHTGSLVISVPQTISEKEYYFALLASNVPQQDFATRSSIGLRAAATSYVIINPSTHPSDTTDIQLFPFDITSTYPFTLFGKKIYITDSSRPQKMNVRFKNIASKTAFVKPRIIINSKNGSEALFDGAHMTLLAPEQSRTIQTDINFSIIPQRHRLTVEIVTQPNHDIFQQIDIISFPFRIIGLLGGILIFLLTYKIALRFKRFTMKKRTIK